MKPDWKDAPDWAKYLAMDSNGAWWWFEDKPCQDQYRWTTYWQVEKCKLGSGAWKKSLEKRPNIKNMEHIKKMEPDRTEQAIKGLINLLMKYPNDDNVKDQINSLCVAEAEKNQAVKDLDKKLDQTFEYLKNAEIEHNGE